MTTHNSKYDLIKLDTKLEEIQRYTQEIVNIQ